MTRQIQLFAGLLILSAAVPAHAQNVRDHRRRPRGPVLSVQDFQPRTGPANTVVTVIGRGFTPRIRVLYSGRRVRTFNIRPTSLQFRVPAGGRDGRIILRHPAVARDIFVGDFALAVTLTVTQVAPRAGAPGTRIEIRGRGFRRGDQVRLAGQALRVLALGPRRIVAAIPRGARAGAIEIVRTGTNTRARGPVFTVLQPPPRILRVTPRVGIPGMRVRLEVAPLAPRATVLYGRTRARELARGPSWIDVEIPTKARVGRFFFVVGPNGRARSATRFSLDLPPRIRRIAPTYGRAGQRVNIFGRNFRPGDQVTLSGLTLPIEQLRDQRITVIVPRGARSGPLVVARGATRAMSPTPFELVRRPRIREIQPRFAQPGEEVAIRGIALTPDVKVSYGAQPMRITRREGNRTLFVRIPLRATNQRFTVRTRGGTARSRLRFQVHRYPTIRAAAPSRGLPGARITLRGRQLRNATGIYLGNTKLAIIRRVRDRMIVVVPDTAQSGTISVESYGRRQPTRFQFTVLQYPAITGFSPQVAYPGTQVTVTGMNFTSTTQVFLGKRPVTIVRRLLPGQIVVQVPASVRGSRFFWAADHGTKVRSQTLFKVISPASLRGFSPARAKAGSHLTLTGTDLNRVVEVLVGKAPAHIVRRPGNTALVVEVPPSTRPGTYYLWLRERTGTTRSRTRFRVAPSAIGRAVIPRAAPRGVTIRVRGQNFDQNTRVSFRGVEMPVVRVGRWGRVIWIRVPDQVYGSGSVMIDDAGSTSRVPGTFRILEPPGQQPPPPPQPQPPGRVRHH